LAKNPAPGVEERVVGFATSQPDWGQFSVANALRREGVKISASGVRAIWQRHGLETLYKRVLAMSSASSMETVQLDARQHAHFARVRRRQLHRDAPAGPARGESPGRREVLLTVAADEFSQHGYKGAALKKIAERAGLLPGSMYHYFKSKQDLLEQVHHASFQELNARVDAALENIDDPSERLRAACRAHLELLLSGSSLSGFVRVRLFIPVGSTLSAKMVRDRKAYERRFRKLVEAAPAPPGADPTILRLGLLGAINWSQVWYRPGRFTPEAIADQLVQIFTGTAGNASRAKSRAVRRPGAAR
jgi:AcrR family transcriptional regulator